MNTKEDTVFPIQSSSYEQRFTKKDPVNADLLAREKASVMIAEDYTEMVAYFIRIWKKDKNATIGEKMKACQALMALQDKLIPTLVKDEDKLKNVKNANKPQEEEANQQEQFQQRPPLKKKAKQND